MSKYLNHSSRDVPTRIFHEHYCFSKSAAVAALFPLSDGEKVSDDFSEFSAAPILLNPGWGDDGECGISRK